MTSSCAALLQKPDKQYDVSVENPTYQNDSPKVLYDEAHLNTHRAKGTYRPFIDLITNDGCSVTTNTKEFSQEILENCDLLIICNAKSDKNLPRDVGAFTNQECEIVNSWVESGGSLLLIADHHPFGLANQALAQTFGVEMGGGSVKNKASQSDQLVFSRTNGLLKKHPILEGRNTKERIEKVITFTGQSLRGNEQAKSLLTLSKTATEVRPDSIWQEDGKNQIRFAKPISVAGLSQALAIEFGAGRVVILGEAGVLSAQKSFGRKFGMNSPDANDNKQFALNILHWLLE
ncbi:MAG: hypothetical protein AAF705_06870 [Bacteroidota bacterium]